MSTLNVRNIVMRSVFKYKQGGLNICLIKMDQFRRVFETCNAHLIIVTETWFKSYRTNLSISMEGYDVIRNDRIARRSGGVAVYVKKGIKTKVIKSSIGLKSEYLFFEVIFPPDVDEIDEFDAVLTELYLLYADVVVMGDFNENLLLRDSSGACTKCVNNTCSVCGEAPTNFDG